MSVSVFQSLSFSDKEHKILQDVCECSDANGYVLTWPVGCPGSLKFKMVTGYGEEGATLYLKIMDRVRETTEGSGNILQDQRVRLKRTTDNIYIIDKVERKRRPLTSQHRIRTDWKQLTLEALCHKRTVAPPTHLYIRGHAKFEGGKLATLHTQRSRKKGKVFIYSNRQSLQLYWYRIFSAMKSREFTSSHSVGKVHSILAIRLRLS